MIKTVFTFFQMQIEGFLRHAIELLQSSFGIRPKAFDPVNVNIANGENVVRVINSQVLGITDINQAVVTAPAVRMNDRIERDTPANNGLQCFSSRVRHDLGVNFAVSLVNTEDNLFAASPATALASDTPRAEIRFVNFDLASGKRRSAFGFFGDAASDFQINLLDRLIGQVSQKSRFISRQIKCKILNDLPCFSLANFSMPIIPV